MLRITLEPESLVLLRSWYCLFVSRGIIFLNDLP